MRVAAHVGGFAGFNDKLTVGADGQVVLTGKGPGLLKLAAEELTRLAAELANFKSFRSVAADPPVRDGMTLVVSYQGQQITVASPGKGRARQGVGDVLAHLQDILARAGQQGAK